MGRTSVCEKTGLRKGAWSPEEDKVLKTYINNNGHGNWNELPKLAGLLRCGKSCRLRWKNYLDPIVKRGDFNKEEVDFIIEMHTLGHRWSKIASHLPRRTDNEIKNFYYTNLKKKDKDNDTPIRERPKPAGKEFTIGKIQSSSIPILESSSMQPIPPQISGSSSSQPISSQTSSHSSSSIDRSVNENHILKEPERDTIINLSDSECPHIEEEPERETLLQMYERLWEEGLSKDPQIPIPPLHSGSNLSMDKSKNKNRILEETENGSLKQTYERVWEEGLSKDPTYPWDCVYGYGIRGSSPQRSLCRLISSRTFSRVSSSIDKSKNENRILEETENGSLKQIYERVWEEGLSEDLHIPDPVFEEQTYPWSSVYVCRREIDYSSFTDESENESSIPEETERGSLKQVYECVRTAAMWVGSLFGFNKVK